MNILLIAPYRTYSGWGEGSKHLAKALNTLPHNLAIRPIYMSNEIDTGFDDPELLQLEAAQYDNYDIVIQRVLPNFFRRVPNTKNLLACVFETLNIRSTPWWRHLNLADAVLVPSLQEKQDLVNHEISVPVYNVSEAIDISKYTQDYEPMADLDRTFNFYFIGEFIERKNIKALLMAFHREFRPDEPVQLVIKTNGNIQHVRQAILDIKANLRIYQDINKYSPEILICGRMSEQEMHNLHRSCHCMVMPSYGEAYCRPVVDALGYGNNPIVTDQTGMTDYVNNANGWPVSSRIEPVYTTQPPMKDIYTSRENWASIDVLHLMKCMRQAYQLKDPPQHQEQILKEQQENVQRFSYTHIGQNIQKVIDDLTS